MVHTASANRGQDIQDTVSHNLVLHPRYKEGGVLKLCVVPC